MLQLQSEIYRRYGQFDEALESIDEVIAMKEGIYGKDHPSVAEALEVKVKIYHHKGVTTEAELLIKRALKIREDSYDENHTEVGRSLHDLGTYYLRLGRYNDAIDQFNKAISITESNFGEYHPEYIERKLNLANALYEEGEYMASLEIVHGLKSIIEETIPIKIHALRGRWLLGMADNYRRTGLFDEALEYIEKAVAMREALYGDVHPSVAEALEIQGKIYNHLGEFEKEEVIWKRIIDSKVHPENHPALAATYYDYAHLFLRKGEYDKAVEHLETSIRITEKSLGRKHSRYYVRLVRLAACYYEQQKFDHAQQTLDDAQRLQNDIFEDSAHPYIARFHQLQSEIYRRTGKFDNALESIDEAIAMKEGIYGRDHPSVADSLEVKVKIYHHKGVTTEAERLIKRALKIREDSYGENHTEVGRSVHDLGSYYLRLGRYNKAIDQFKKAISITESNFGEYHPEYIERTLNLANALYEEAEYDDSLRIVDKLEPIIEKTIKVKNHFLKGRWLLGKAYLHRRKGDFDGALDYIGKSLEMRVALYGGEAHPSVAEALECKGKIYNHLGEFDKEELIWNKIIDSKVYSENHPALATTYYNYAHLFLRQGEFAQAVEKMKVSIEITKNILGRDHTHYFGRMVRLAVCYYEQQKFGKAQKTLDEVKGLQTKIFGESPHAYIARFHQLQSEIDRSNGEFDKALENIDKAIKMKEEVYDIDHPSVAESLEIKVELTLAQFQLKKTKDLLERIEEIRQRYYGIEHPEYANYQLRLAEYLIASNEYDQARVELEKSLRNCELKLAAEHPEIIKRHVTLARLARISGDIDKAVKHVDEAFDALGERRKKEKSLILSSILREKSDIYRRQSNYKASLLELEKALEIEMEIVGTESPRVTELLINRAKLLIISLNLEKAEEAIELALENTFSEAPIVKLLKADALEQLALLEKNKMQYDQAIKSLDSAILLKAEVMGDVSVEVAKLYVDKAEVLRLQKKFDDAFVFLERAQNINNPNFTYQHVYFARIFLESGKVSLSKKSYLKAKVSLEEALDIYESQPRQDLREHAYAAESLGCVFLETGFLELAVEQFKAALDIKRDIYDSEHFEIAQTLMYEAQACLKMARISSQGFEQFRESAKENLNEALAILQKRQSGVELTMEVELREEIESTLSTL